MRQHLNFEHRPWAYGSKTSYRIEASLVTCPIDGWSTTDTVRHPLRKVLALIDAPSFGPWDQPFPHFLKQRFHAVLQAEWGRARGAPPPRWRGARDPIDPDDPWLPTGGPP